MFGICGIWLYMNPSREYKIQNLAKRIENIVHIKMVVNIDFIFYYKTKEKKKEFFELEINNKVIIGTNTMIFKYCFQIEEAFVNTKKILDVKIRKEIIIILKEDNTNSDNNFYHLPIQA